MEEIRTVLPIGEIRTALLVVLKNLGYNDLLRKYDWEKNRQKGARKN